MQFYPKLIPPINYIEFAILNDDERNLCLTNAEKRIKNVQLEIENYLKN